MWWYKYLNTNKGVRFNHWSHISVNIMSTLVKRFYSAISLPVPTQPLILSGGLPLRSARSCLVSWAGSAVPVIDAVACCLLLTVVWWVVRSSPWSELQQLVLNENWLVGKWGNWKSLLTKTQNFFGNLGLYHRDCDIFISPSSWCLKRKVKCEIVSTLLSWLVTLTTSIKFPILVRGDHGEG